MCQMQQLSAAPRWPKSFPRPSSCLKVDLKHFGVRLLTDDEEDARECPLGMCGVVSGGADAAGLSRNADISGASGAGRAAAKDILGKLFYMVRPAKHVVRFCQEIATSVRPSNI